MIITTQRRPRLKRELEQSRMIYHECRTRQSRHTHTHTRTNERVRTHKHVYILYYIGRDVVIGLWKPCTASAQKRNGQIPIDATYTAMQCYLQKRHLS